MLPQREIGHWLILERDIWKKSYWDSLGDIKRPKEQDPNQEKKNPGSGRENGLWVGN